MTRVEFDPDGAHVIIGGARFRVLAYDAATQSLAVEADARELRAAVATDYEPLPPELERELVGRTWSDPARPR